MPDLHVVDHHADDSDLTLLRQLRADVPPPGADALTAARLRLTAAIDVPTPATHTAGRARYTRRAAVGVAAALALGLGAYALTGQDPNPGAQAGPSVTTGPGVSATTPSTVPSTPAPHYATVAQLLDAASTAALRSIAPAGRYLHTSSHSRDTSSVDDPPDNGAYEFTENRSDSWQPGTAGQPGYEHDVTNISVTAPTAQQRRYLAAAPGGLGDRTDTWYRVAADGSETQFFPAGGDDPACAGGCGTSIAWEGATAQNVAALPAGVAALRADLFSYADTLHAEATKYGKPTTVGSIALQGVATVLGSGDAGAKLHSALYQVAKTIPGIILNGSMANFDGVRGVAISTTDPFDVEQNLIFAADGSAFLGERDVVVHPSAQYHLRAGTVVTWTAVHTEITGKPTLPQ